MNLCGLTDSLATLGASPNECPHCHTASRIAHGLCLACLLRSGEAEADNSNRQDDFDAALDAVVVADTHWRLGNYEILEEIGRGGMGVIYRARQRHSRRIVALKRILSYHADSRETLARFRREAEAAASLDHPNILPIYEVGDSEEGVPYFSMKYASGGSLQEVGPALRNDPREVVRLLAKVTRAVQYAHRQGILHRDLKPGNILLDGRGEPMVSDFGLAKWLDTTSDLTRTLTIFGTPGYIAPEQAEGPAASLRPSSDIYSLGAILFDLLTGRPPFLGEHALAVIRQASEKPAPKLRSLVHGADRDLETICSRCLEREPVARYRSAGDLAEDLERWLEGRPIVARPVSPPLKLWRWSKRNPLLAGSLAATIIICALAIVRQVETRGLARTVRESQLAAHSIAILPFLDLETAQTDAAFANSFASALRGEMASLGATRIIAVADGAAGIPGAGSLPDLRSIGVRTGCRTVLMGTVRGPAGKRRTSIHLSEAETGDTLFEVTTEPNESKAQVFQLPNGIVSSLFTALSDNTRPPAISGDPALIDSTTNEFVRAGDDLMTHRTIADIDRALTCYQRAIDLQPKSAIARADFVIAAVAKVQLGPSDPGLLQKAETFGREAVALNPIIAPTHRALGGLLFYVRRNISESREEALRVIEAGDLSDGPALLGAIHKTEGRPDLALRWYGINSHWRVRPADDESVIGDCWADLGEDTHAERVYQRVAGLHPELPDGWMGLCRLRLLANDFAAARKLCRANADRYQQFSYPAQVPAQVEFFARDYAEAEKLYKNLEQGDPDGGGSFYGAVSYQSALGRLRIATGDEASGRAILENCRQLETEALAHAPQHPEILYRLAAIESSLGEGDRATDYLRAAAAAGWLDYRSLQLDPRFDGIRNDSRYQKTFETMASRVLFLQKSISTDWKSN
jgi:tetratricopeptide (TPR) repeat protein/tRNA A-37 threonylcarbamoyl transferase component Bud32/TolB-like protein